MFRIVYRLKKNEKGQALVEFALVFVFVLIPILFGIMEFGRIFSANLIVINAAREGARVGVVTSPALRKSAIETAVIDRGASLGLTTSNVVISPNPPSSAGRGQTLEVTVNFQVDLIAPVISNILPNPFPVRGVANMRVE